MACVITQTYDQYGVPSDPHIQGRTLHQVAEINLIINSVLR